MAAPVGVRMATDQTEDLSLEDPEPEKLILAEELEEDSEEAANTDEDGSLAEAPLEEETTKEALEPEKHSLAVEDLTLVEEERLQEESSEEERPKENSQEGNPPAEGKEESEEGSVEDSQVDEEDTEDMDHHRHSIVPKASTESNLTALGIETSASGFLASTTKKDLSESEPMHQDGTTSLLTTEATLTGTPDTNSINPPEEHKAELPQDSDIVHERASAPRDSQAEHPDEDASTAMDGHSLGESSGNTDNGIVTSKSSSLTAFGVETSASVFLATAAEEKPSSAAEAKEANEQEQQQQASPAKELVPQDEEPITPQSTSGECFRMEDDGNGGQHPNDPRPDTDTPMDECKRQPKRGVCPWWTRCTAVLHRAILHFVLSLAQYAARRPWTVVIAVPVFSCLVMAIGLFTNFVVVYDPEEFLIPFGTPIEKQYDWIAETFSDTENIHIGMLIHKNGDNVLTVETTRKVLEVMDHVFNTTGYKEVCGKGDYVDIYGHTTCWSYSVARFWDFNSSHYDATIHSDEDVMKMISKATFPFGGTPVAHDILLGNHESEKLNGLTLITNAQSYVINIELPWAPGVEDLEYELIQTLYALRERWSQLSQDPVQLEFLAQLSLEMEVERAIRQDLPLFPLVFLVMSNFCSVVFFRRDKVKSRWLLGYGAVATITCSILTGFGFLFIAGVPVSSMLLVLPFIVFGIGLDDTFIITGAYFRTEDLTSDIYERITITMKEIGLSIFLTTLTTTVAFILSSLSTIRAIRWLGWYATITIFIDFIYQITLYCALLVLDERRIQANRRDVCFWIVLSRDDNNPSAPLEATTPESEMGITRPARGEAETDNSLRQGDQHQATTGSEFLEPPKPLDEDQNVLATKTSEESQPDDCDSDSIVHVTPIGTDDNSPVAAAAPSAEEHNTSGQDHLSDRLMMWYSRKLLPKRWFQLCVIVLFLGYYALCCYRTTLLKQEFRTQDFVPDDSYVAAFLDSVAAYVTFEYVTGVYFRGVNQSDFAVQEQMRSYIEDLGDLPHVGGNPPFCWVTDLPTFQVLYMSKLENLTITEQIEFALSIPALNEMYGPDIIIDNSTGDIVASRCWLYMRAIDMDDVDNQLDFYGDQNEVALAQPVNAGRKAKPFFSFDYVYFAWEFYAAIDRELTNSTISGIIAVGVISLLLIPHWSAIFFVIPLITILYIDVMGTIHLLGLNVDSMTFVCIIVSVGLLVDFLMHVFLRYIESPGPTRTRKVQQTLTTMGPSIFVGGLSTLLGVLPLSLGSSMVVRTVFLCFFAMVVIGLLHGLIFLPVVLLLIGPINSAKSGYQSLVDKPIKRTSGGEFEQRESEGACETGLPDMC